MPLPGILPCGGIGIAEEESPIPRVFGIDVDLSVDDGLPDQVGRAEFRFVLDLETAVSEHQHDHLSQQGAFGVDFRCHCDGSLLICCRCILRINTGRAQEYSYC